MKIRVLGCHGAKLSNHRTCGFLINGSVLLDAGTICSSLTLSEQGKIRYVLISHIHADHIKDLTFLSENLIEEKRRRPVVIISLGKILAGLQRNLFNNQIWPDFTKLPNSRNPVFRLKAIREGQTIKIDGLEVKAFRVNHIIPCAGFLIREKNSSILYSGDTYRTDKLWKAAAKEPHLKAAMIETSFPNALEDLAVRSKHLTPNLLVQEFSKIGKPRLPLYVYHLKPLYLKRIGHELKQLKVENLTVLKDGQIFKV
ncbi:MAG: 3',5'-cyclic-nucleotide phosphodiesterase [Nitrospirae bacterium]|nr:3',5'-cyclic-nucleotide phosphodiesterase [Nitrospirota bacterium]